MEELGSIFIDGKMHNLDLLAMEEINQIEENLKIKEKDYVREIKEILKK